MLRIPRRCTLPGPAPTAATELSVPPVQHPADRLASVEDRLPERPVNLTIRGENTDLSILAAVVPGITDLQGPVDIRVDITGTSSRPQFAGEATLEGGALTIEASGVTYEDLRGTVSFDNDEIRTHVARALELTAELVGDQAARSDRRARRRGADRRAQYIRRGTVSRAPDRQIARRARKRRK